MITIAKGTLPLAIFGPVGYGRRNGLLSVPTRIAESRGAVAVRAADRPRSAPARSRVSAGLCLAAFASLWLLRVRAVAAPADPPI